MRRRRVRLNCIWLLAPPERLHDVTRGRGSGTTIVGTTHQVGHRGPCNVGPGRSKMLENTVLSSSFYNDAQTFKKSEAGITHRKTNRSIPMPHNTTVSLRSTVRTPEALISPSYFPVPTMWSNKVTGSAQKIAASALRRRRALSTPTYPAYVVNAPLTEVSYTRNGVRVASEVHAWPGGVSSLPSFRPPLSLILPPF